MRKKRKLTDNEITQRLNQIFEAEPELGKLDPMLETMQYEMLARENWSEEFERVNRRRRNRCRGVADGSTGNHILRQRVDPPRDR